MDLCSESQFSRQKHFSRFSFVVFFFVLSMKMPLSAEADGSFVLDPKVDSKTLQTILKRFAVPLGEDKYFYRWQNAEVAEDLLKRGRMDETLLQFYLTGNDGASRSSYGRGLYVASVPTSSANFGERLVRVKIPKGTVSLDLESMELRAFCEDREILHLNADSFSDVPIVLKVDDVNDWWVVRAKDGVEFSRITPFEMEPARLMNLRGNYQAFKDETVKSMVRRRLSPRGMGVLKVAFNRGKSYPKVISELIASIESSNELFRWIAAYSAVAGDFAETLKSRAVTLQLSTDEAARFQKWYHANPCQRLLRNI
ncbi:MAG: hypothetical protein HYW49_06490 [Deltaproteobacteria bacterium]|nr:hypothetical protein [Deltaproteobacteria bacterium]